VSLGEVRSGQKRTEEVKMAKIKIEVTYELEVEDPTAYDNAWEILELVIDSEPQEIRVAEVSNV